MLETANYKLKIYEGEDNFNPLDVENANMRTIDTAMKENQNTGDTNTAEIAQIKTVQEQHGTDITRLQTASNTHEHEIGNLQALVNKQTGDIAEVGADVAGMQTQVSTLQTQVQTNKNQIDGLKVSVGNNTTGIASLDNRVGALEGQEIRLKRHTVSAGTASSISPSYMADMTYNTSAKANDTFPYKITISAGNGALNINPPFTSGKTGTIISLNPNNVPINIYSDTAYSNTIGFFVPITAEMNGNSTIIFKGTIVLLENIMGGTPPSARINYFVKAQDVRGLSAFALGF